MHEHMISDPLLNEDAELIIDEPLLTNAHLIKTMQQDIAKMDGALKTRILQAMFRMHKYFEDECGDLDVALTSVDEIPTNTEAWYIVLHEQSSNDVRAVSYNYKTNWETAHGVEVIVINGHKLIYVGHCGYVSSPCAGLSPTEMNFNFA